MPPTSMIERRSTPSDPPGGQQLAGVELDVEPGVWGEPGAGDAELHLGRHEVATLRRARGRTDAATIHV